MNSFISEIIKFLNNRFSGKISQHVKIAKESLKVINSLPPRNGDKFWLSWYKAYLKDISRNLFIPTRIIIKKMLKNITENDKIVLKDIKLPVPATDSDSGAFVMSIMDSLLPYLLDNIEKESFYALKTPSMEGHYEYKSVVLEKGDIVIDAGANIGEFSALAGVKECQAYAFEPIPNVIDKYLSKTAEMNPNITICPYALSDKKGELTFTETLGLCGSSFINTVENGKKIKVQAIDLDTFVEKNKLSSVDFIKSDIEGAERYMLTGAKRVLKEFAPKISICTYHLPDDPKVLRELILDANPDYVIEERWKKMYAYVPKSKQ